MLELLKELKEICTETIQLGYIIKYIGIGAKDGEEIQEELSQALLGVSRYQLELGSKAWELSDKFEEFIRENK